MIPLERAFIEAVNELTDDELAEAEVFVTKLAAEIRTERFTRREVSEEDRSVFWVET